MQTLAERCTCFWLHCVQEWLQGVPAIRQFYRLLLCFAAKALNHKSINNSKFSSQRQPTKISSDGKGGKCHCIFPEFSCLRSIWIWQVVQSGEKAAKLLREKLVNLMSDSMQEELCIYFSGKMNEKFRSFFSTKSENYDWKAILHIKNFLFNFFFGLLWFSWIFQPFL